MNDTVSEKLNFEPTASEAREYHLRRALAKLAVLPGMLSLSRALAKTAVRIQNFHDLQGSIARDRRTLDQRGDGTGQAGNEFGSGFGYKDDFREIEVAAYYRAQIEAGDLDAQRTESGAVYTEAVRIIGDALAADPSIRTAINFGVSYGYLDELLARRFPQIAFKGVDRSPLTKAYNDEIFATPNLEFVAGDIFDFLKTLGAGAPSLMYHVRTLTLLPRDFVRKLYAAACDAGVTRIVGMEQCGISWQTGKPYEFSDRIDAPSIVFRNGMFIHNYPGLLAEAGYRVTDAKLLKTNHPDSTYRIACVSAERA